MRASRRASDCSIFKRRLSSEGLIPGWPLMIASIEAKTCSLVPFDAGDLVCERFELGLPFIHTSICEQNLRPQGCRSCHDELIACRMAGGASVRWICQA